MWDRLAFTVRTVAANWLLLTFILVTLGAWIAQRKIASPVFRKRARRVYSSAVMGTLLILFGVGCDSCSGCMSHIMEGYAAFKSAELARKGKTNVVHGLVRPLPAATSANAFTSTPYLPFMGNVTLLLPDVDTTSQQIYAAGLLRQSDCSLTEYFLTNYDQTANTFSTQATYPNYQATLRALAQLPPKAGSFPSGCKDSTLGIASSAGVVLGLTTDGSKYIAAGIDPFNDDLLTGTIDLTNGTIVQNTVSSITNAAAVATADLNGDGRNDLIVAANTNSGAGQLYVFLSNGDGTFQTPVAYAATTNAIVGFTADDVNGDGQLDLIATGNYSGVETLLGKGDGTFQTAVASSVTGAASLATGDFNGDGKKDLVLSNGSILLGKGDGTFAAAAFTLSLRLGTNAAVGSVAVGDFNNDGKLDVAINIPGGPYISVFNGKGDGTFTAGPSYANISDSSDLTVTDLDGDGHLDLISGIGGAGAYGPSVGTHTGLINILMGNGDGTFQGAPSFPGAAAPLYTGSSSPAQALAVGDFNGDGKADILGSAASITGGLVAPGGLELLSGDGSGQFTASAPIGSSSPTIIVAGDMNGDHKLDAVFADGSPSGGATNLGIALGDGSGGFGAVTDYAIPNSVPIANIVTGDFTGDGKPDVVVTTSGALTSGPNSIYLFTNNGDGTLAAPVAIDAPTNTPVGLAAGDLNGDGKLDFVITTASNSSANTTGALLVYLNQGSGSFAPPASLSPGYNPGPVTIGDLNGDGKLDIVVASTDQNYTAGTLSVYLGKGDGTFATPQTLQAPNVAAGNTLSIADMDGDGHADVIWGNTLPMIAFGDGTGALQGPTGLALSSVAQTLVPVDLNGDGHPDLVSVCNNSINVFMSLYGTALASPVATGTALTVSPNPATADQSITFSATVTPASGSAPPTGTVAFMNGTTQLGSGTLDATGKATFSTSNLAAGTYSVTAVYAGDTNFGGSTSPAVSLTVNTVAGLVATASSLTISPNPATVGQTVMLTATVTRASGTAIPTGSVAFMNGSTQLGTGPLDGSGKATYSTSSPTAGTYSVTAVYGGDTNFSGSTSSAVSLTVNTATSPGDFTLGTSASALTVTKGQSGTLTMTVTPQNGFSQSVSFACSGLPSESTCSFSPVTVTPSGSTAATTTMTIATTAATTGALVWPLTGGFTFAFAFFFARRRNLLPGLLCLLILGGIGMTALGCGGGSHKSSAGSGGDPGTPTGNSTVTIAATSGSGAGAITHSTTVTLTVQ
ncbi:MAG: beta strand repeat-containing protein [Acidobacteriota bacterium]